MGWGWYDREPTRRRPADGIRAQTQSGQFGKTWWAGKWLDALERLVDPGRLSRGRSYARSGQVLNIDIAPGKVSSRVQGSRPTPYKVEITITPLSAEEWERVAGAMAEQAVFAAKLLAGDMPQNIDEAFTACKVSLFPDKKGDLQTKCSCPDYANPCKHVAAVYYLLGEQFDADPFLIFRLRGKGKEDLLEMLRRRRAALAPASAIEAAPVTAPVETPEVEEERGIPLVECLGRFWEQAEDLDDMHVAIKGPDIDAVPVKRLGRPGFWQGRQDWMELVGSFYRSVTEKAMDVALGQTGKNR